ncbi:MAG: RHS repeat-associated core domain-containing protein, partial [Armatimonadetes bacterium]
ANSAFVSDWDGFTEIHQGPYDNHATSIAYIVATGSDTNPEITVVDEWAEAIVTIQVWRNVDTTDPIDADQGSADSSANNTDFTLSGITTTVDDAVIVAFGYGKPSGATFTPPSGWTEDTDHQSTNRTSTSAHTTQATQGATGTVTFTRSASSNIGTGSVIALTPATTSGGTGTPTLIAASASTHQGDATPTITLPTGIQADDVIVMHVGSKQANSAFVSDWDGFTEIHQGTYDNHATSIAYKVASGSDTDPEITVVDQWAEAIVTIQVWRGIDTTNPIDADQGSADSSANNTDYTLTGITTTTNNAAIVAFAYGKPAGVTFTPPSGWTEDTDKASTNRSETSAHTIQTNPGTTGNITFTRSSPSDTGAGSVIALTPTPAVTIEGTFYYFHNGALAGQTTNNIFTHVLTDHQGTPHTTWTPDTGETNRRLHQTWGSVRHDDGLDNTHSYTAQDQDPTALMHYNARNYDPTIGRFISPDTIIPNPTNPQDFNRYSYVGNNPTNYTDPTGHDPDESYLCPGVMYECTKDVKTFSVGLWDSWAKNHPGYGHRRADELVRSSDSISEYARFSLGFVLGTLDPVIAAGAGAARLLADRATEASAALRNGERWGGKWLSDIQRIRGVVAIGRAVRDIRVIKAATRTAPYVGMGLIVYDNYQEDQSLARTGVESAVEIAVDLSITLIVGVACSTVVGCLVAVPGGVAVATVLAPALGEWIADYFVGPQP